jgi:hypothetical protein
LILVLDADGQYVGQIALGRQAVIGIDIDAVFVGGERQFVDATVGIVVQFVACRLAGQVGGF